MGVSLTCSRPWKKSISTSPVLQFHGPSKSQYVFLYWNGYVSHNLFLNGYGYNIGSPGHIQAKEKIKIKRPQNSTLAAQQFLACMIFLETIYTLNTSLEVLWAVSPTGCPLFCCSRSTVERLLYHSQEWACVQFKAYPWYPLNWGHCCLDYCYI